MYQNINNFFINTVICDKKDIMKERKYVPHEASNNRQGSENKTQWELCWRHVIFLGLTHVAAIYSIYLHFFKAMWTTVIYMWVVGYISGLGVTAGSHRLWAHRCYKARLPLQLILLYLQTMSMQNSVIWWVRDHRMHHKYSETDADPHNASRGFFFSHIGWLLVKKHPAIKAKGHTIDMSDITENPLMRLQDRYYLLLAPIACFVIPTYIPSLWDETLWNSFFLGGILRYVLGLHITFLVNSAAHLWGQNRPYDDNIQPVETKVVSAITLGEGFHNYHHTFPWDYKTAELGNYSLNLTTMFIDLMAKIGWAYGLKTVSSDVIEKRAQRTGDGSHRLQHNTFVAASF